MRRVLVVAGILLGLLLVAAIGRVAVSVFTIAPAPGWVADGNDVHGDPLPEGAVARLGTVRFRTTTWTNLCWLDDGRIASGGFDNEIVIWDAETGERTQVLAGHRAPIPERLRRWSWRETRDAVLEGKPPVRHDYLHYGHLEQSGDFLISAGASVREWDLRTGAGRLLATARGGNISHFDLLDEGNVIRYTIGNREYHLDRRTGKRDRRRLDAPDFGDRPEWVARDGSLRIDSEDGGLTIRNASDGTERTVRGPGEGLSARGVTLDPEATTLWCVWVDAKPSDHGARHPATLTVIDLASLTIRDSVELGEGNSWTWSTLSHDGALLALCTVDGRVQLRDVATLQLVHEIRTPAARFLPASFSPDDSRLVLRSGGTAAVVMYDVRTGERALPVLGHEARVAAAVFLDDERVLTAGEDGMHRTWDARTGEVLWERRGTRLEVPADTPQDDALAVATERGALWVRTDDGSVIASRDVPDGWQVVGTSPAGTLLVQTEQAIAIFGPEDDAPREVVDRGVAPKATEGLRTSHVAWHPATDRLLVADATRTRIDEHSWQSVTVLRMLDARSGSDLWVLDRSLPDPVVDFHDERVAMAWGKHVAIYDGDGAEVQRWKLADEDAFVTAVEFAPDGERIATGDDKRAVYVWSLDSGALLKTLRGHGGSVTALTWSPDGTLLVSTSTDTTALVWDVAE